MNGLDAPSCPVHATGQEGVGARAGKRKAEQVMQQKEALRQPFSSGAVFQRSLRDRVGVSIEARDTVEALSLIREAEQAGIQHVWMTVGDAGRADILTLFAAVATQTERIRLGTAIVPTYPLHPIVLVRQALAVDDLAPGRLRLGIGPSHRSYLRDAYGLSQISPLSHLKEYLEVLRDVLWEGRTNYHGAFFQVAYTLPRTPQIPLLTSALGSKAFRLAGEIADGAISRLCPVPYLLKSALPALRAGAEASLRPAPPIVAHMLVALCTDEAAVQEVTRRQWVQQALRFEVFTRMFAEAGFSKAVDGEDRDLDALARTLVISGNEATVRSRVQELCASGLDELMLTLVPMADEARERTQLFRLIGSL